MRILYTRADGGLSVVNAVDKAEIEKVLGSLTDEEYAKHVWERSVPEDALNAMEISDDYQLPDREYRDAWMQNGKKITHDLSKVKEIALKKLRVIRDPLLVKYDGLQARAIDLDDKEAMADLKAKKQALRDATNALKSINATSIDEVKKAIPDLTGYYYDN